VAPKNRALRERLNQGVAWLKSSGALRGISEAWFGYDVSQKRAGAWVGSPDKP
jgi:ABC-type amino acid transport substrate-binding protein